MKKENAAPLKDLANGAMARKPVIGSMGKLSDRKISHSMGADEVLDGRTHKTAYKKAGEP